MFKKIAIIGTGLIGGSLALAIKKKKIACEIVGVSRHKKSISLAKKIGAIDRGSQDLGIIKNSDLVILATPVNTILNLAPRISGIIDKRCIVTDVGSTKRDIVAKLERIFPNFVGSHPLAGSEKRSILNANAQIFKDSLCILTPTKMTKIPALNKVKLFWRIVGAKTVFLNPKTHDNILSVTSHLPHAVAFALIGIVPDKYFKFSAGGLKDSTRIALSDNELWADIFLSNKKNILKSIDSLQSNLSRIKSAIRLQNRNLLSKILKRAHKKREKLQ